MTDDVDTLAQIIREVGDPNGTLDAVIAGIWAGWAVKGNLSAELQYLYTKRSCLDIRLAEESPNTTYSVHAISWSGGQKFDHLQQMRADCHAELIRIEMNLRGQRRGASGTITKTTPESPPYPNGADANDPFYSGDPYLTLRRP